MPHRWWHLRLWVPRDTAVPRGWVLSVLGTLGQGAPWCGCRHGHEGQPANRCKMGRPRVWVLVGIGAARHGGPTAWVPARVSSPWHGRGCSAPSPQEHFNYYSLDPALGHLVFSLKYDEQEHLHLLLR